MRKRLLAILLASLPGLASSAGAQRSQSAVAIGATIPVATIAALRTTSGSDGRRAQAANYASVDDRGGGEFWFDASDTSSSDNGCDLIVNNQSPRNGTWKRVLRGRTLSVTECGAKADQTQATQSFFQAAIDRMSALGGGRVLVPCGNFYHTTGTITLKSSVTLEGEGDCSIIRAFAQASTYNIVTVNTSAVNWAIKNLQIVGSTARDDSPLIRGTTLQQGIIDGVLLQDAEDAAIFLENSSDIRISNFKIKNIYQAGDTTGGVGIWLYKGTQSIVIENGHFDTLGTTAIWLDAGTNDGLGVVVKNVTANNLVITNSAQHPNGAECIAIEGGQHSTFSNIVCRTQPTTHLAYGIFVGPDQADIPPVGNIFSNITLESLGASCIVMRSGYHNVFSNISCRKPNLAIATVGGGRKGYAIEVDSGAVVVGSPDDCTDNIFDNITVNEDGAGTYDYGVLLQAQGGGANIYRNTFSRIRWDTPITALYQKVEGGGFTAPTSGVNANRFLKGPHQTGLVALTYGATVNTDALLGSSFSITATNTTAYTIANPTNATDGDVITYYILNSSGGVMGAITWGTTFELAGVFINPLNTKARTITFVYRDSATKWTEVSRAAADI